MNWTGGRLRHSKNPGGNVVSRQKQHFAKARTQLPSTNRTAAVSFRPSFLSREGDDSRGKIPIGPCDTQLARKQSLSGALGDRKNPSVSQQVGCSEEERSRPVLGEENARVRHRPNRTLNVLSLSPKDEIVNRHELSSARVGLSEPVPYATPASPQLAVRGRSSDTGTNEAKSGDGARHLDAKKEELLMKGNWVGINPPHKRKKLRSAQQERNPQRGRKWPSRGRLCNYPDKRKSRQTRDGSLDWSPGERGPFMSGAVAIEQNEIKICIGPDALSHQPHRNNQRQSPLVGSSDTMLFEMKQGNSPNTSCAGNNDIPSQSFNGHSLRSERNETCPILPRSLSPVNGDNLNTTSENVGFDLRNREGITEITNSVVILPALSTNTATDECWDNARNMQNRSFEDEPIPTSNSVHEQAECFSIRGNDSADDLDWSEMRRVCVDSHSSVDTNEVDYWMTTMGHEPADVGMIAPIDCFPESDGHTAAAAAAAKVDAAPCLLPMDTQSVAKVFVRQTANDSVNDTLWKQFVFGNEGDVPVE